MVYTQIIFPLCLQPKSFSLYTYVARDDFQDSDADDTAETSDNNDEGQLALAAEKKATMDKNKKKSTATK